MTRWYIQLEGPAERPTVWVWSGGDYIRSWRLSEPVYAELATASLTCAIQEACARHGVRREGRTLLVPMREGAHVRVLVRTTTGDAMYKLDANEDSVRDLVRAKIMEADQLYPPTQARAKKAYVFGALFALVDLPLLNEEQEQVLARVLDDELVPPLVALLKHLVQSIYEGLKRVLSRRRKKRWQS